MSSVYTREGSGRYYTSKRHHVSPLNSMIIQIYIPELSSFQLHSRMECSALWSVLQSHSTREWSSITLQKRALLYFISHFRTKWAHSRMEWSLPTLQNGVNCTYTPEGSKRYLHGATLPHSRRSDLFLHSRMEWSLPTLQNGVGSIYSQEWSGL